MALDDAVGAWSREDPTVLNDRWPLYKMLRDTAPFYRFQTTTIVSRYDDVSAVLSDESTFQNGPFAAGSDGLHGVPDTLAAAQRTQVLEIIDFQSHWMTASNGERHDQLRRFGQRVFSTKAVAAMQTTVDDVVDELLTDVARVDEVEFVDRVAYRLPLAVISEMLDMSVSLRNELHLTWLVMVKALSGLEWRRSLPRNLDEIHGSYVAMGRILQQFIDEKREGTSSELLQRMFETQEADPSITDMDLVGVLSQLFAAGHQTTQDLLSSAVFTLLTHPDQWRDVREDDRLVRSAVEEVLRYRSPSQAIQRRAVRDAEFGDYRVAAGDHMTCLIGSANHDEQRFEDAATFNIRRPDAKYHVAFGQGPHFCLGAALSRMEAATGLRALARRFPEVELVSDEVSWTGGVGLLGPSSLRLRLGRDHSS
jgi:cytochrome P450